MNRIPGLKVDVGFGLADAKLPDWRKAKELGDNEPDPDDEETETAEDVKAVLGFDPAKEKDEDMETTTENSGLRAAVLNRLAANKCGSKFKSEAQRAFLAIHEPEVAHKWRHKGKGKPPKLPERVKDRARLPEGAVANLPNCSMRSAVLSRMAKNATALEQFSPSPVIGKYAHGFGKKAKTAKNAAFGSKYEEAKHPRLKGKWRAKWEKTEQSGVPVHAAVHESGVVATVMQDPEQKGLWRATTAHPKGGRKTTLHQSHEEAMKAGEARLSTGNRDNIDLSQLAVGTKHEKEHTSDPQVARKIAMDHLCEDPEYYTKLQKCMKD